MTNRQALSRNVIGSEPPMTPVVDRRAFAPLGDIGTSRRPSEPTMKVFHPSDPDNVETHSRPNARDMINHLGWQEYVEQVEVVEEAEDDEDPGVRPDRATNASGAVLEELRDKIRKAGGTVDLRWGLNRLKQRVAQLELPNTADGEPA